MATFEENKKRYMLESLPASGRDPAVSTPIVANSKIEPLIMGKQYFAQLKSVLATLNGPGSFFYATGWRIHPDFSLDGPTGGMKLTHLLAAKAKAGMDVRVLGWVLPPEVLNSKLLRFALSRNLPQVAPFKWVLETNDDTMASTITMRGEPLLQHKAGLNILGHPAGAIHQKFVLCGDAQRMVCFTGGIDFVPNRHDASWHDVQVMATGWIVQNCFNAFRDMWNEQLTRPVQSLTADKVTADTRSHMMPNLSLPSPFVTGGAGRMHAQSLRTHPAMRFTALTRPVMPTNKPISYAPNGIFEIKAVWEKAVRAGSKYVYIEDQGFFSTQVFDWVNAALLANPEMRAVLVTAPDPADEGNSLMRKILERAITQHLRKGFTDAEIADKIGFFWRKTGAVHSKTTIVDDVWAIVGSANAMRRSLYTDMEHSIAWMDEDTTAIPTYRMDLWGQHLQQSIPDLDSALQTWFNIPYRTSGAATTNPLPVVRVDIRNSAMPDVKLNSDEQEQYDSLFDADSRQEWGGSLGMWLVKQAPGLVSP